MARATRHRILLLVSRSADFSTIATVRRDSAEVRVAGAAAAQRRYVRSFLAGYPASERSIRGRRSETGVPAERRLACPVAADWQYYPVSGPAYPLANG